MTPPPTPLVDRIGRFGVWTQLLSSMETPGASQAAKDIEDLGYGAIWIPGRVGSTVLRDAEGLLAATSSIHVATGILNIWMHDPATVATTVTDLSARYNRRIVLGLGVSHQRLVAEAGQEFSDPIGKMNEYLDRLDELGEEVGSGRRLLAALGPRMLRLGRERAAGAHPYLVPPQHARNAREILGPERVLAPEVHVVLEEDPGIARGLARRWLTRSLELTSYLKSLRQYGFTDEDFTGGGSDALVDEVVAWGPLEKVAERLGEYHEAGADHVAIQVLGEGGWDQARSNLRQLAGVLL